MSKMGNILLDIEERVVNSAVDYEAMAQEYGVTPEWIKNVVDAMYSEEYSPYQTCNS